MRKPTELVVDAPPGQEAQVDFGLMDTMHDPVTGRPRRLYALVVTLLPGAARAQPSGART